MSRPACGAGSRARRFLGAVVLLGALSACAPQIRDYGYAPSQSELSGIVVGVDSRDRVAQVIGYPTSRGLNKDSAWYYIASRQETVGFKAPKITDREVVEITFDKEGTVTNISRYGLKDGRVIVLNRRVTTDTTQGVGFLKQLFGNIGQFTPSDVTGGGAAR